MKSNTSAIVKRFIYDLILDVLMYVGCFVAFISCVWLFVHFQLAEVFKPIITFLARIVLCCICVGGVVMWLINLWCTAKENVNKKETENKNE